MPTTSSTGRGERGFPWLASTLRYVFVVPAALAACVGWSLAHDHWRPLWAGLGGYAVFGTLQIVGFVLIRIAGWRQGQHLLGG
jgi:hypothetical protein